MFFSVIFPFPRKFLLRVIGVSFEVFFIRLINQLLSGKKNSKLGIGRKTHSLCFLTWGPKQCLFIWMAWGKIVLWQIMFEQKSSFVLTNISRTQIAHIFKSRLIKFDFNLMEINVNILCLTKIYIQQFYWLGLNALCIKQYNIPYCRYKTRHLFFGSLIMKASEFTTQLLPDPM